MDSKIRLWVYMMGSWCGGVILGLFFMRVIPSFPYLAYAVIIGGTLLGFKFARKL